MLRLNLLLEAVGIDLTRTRLVRHQSRAEKGRSPYDLWLASDGQFEKYQRIQSREHFRNCDWIISFVATPLDETLFSGVFNVRDVGTAPAGMTDPVGGHDVTGLFFYDLEPDQKLREYIGRIVIEWGPGFRSWVQRPDRQDKSILEIRRTAVDPPFPGFMSFRWRMKSLSQVPTSWRGALRAVSGVYILACQKTGKRYVGSAYGEGGFWSRWEEYLNTGHGGNIGIRKLEDHDFQVAILEVVSSSASVDEIIRTEDSWKEKLLTRKFGLNEN